mmetsp:Transcript_4793/g.6716  ORF Transcript_4793/g.6716 Transcript_4793/m.6716 type:complete len:861 (+) Transcript_4793:508-3090(+)
MPNSPSQSTKITKTLGIKVSPSKKQKKIQKTKGSSLSPSKRQEKSSSNNRLSPRYRSPRQKRNLLDKDEARNQDGRKGTNNNTSGLNHNSHASASGLKSESHASASYKGFSTSITSIFSSPSNARVDCCALSCCGMFQSDYNRYVLLGKRPPTFKNRFLQYIGIPLAMFFVAGAAAVFIPYANVNQFTCTTLLFLCLFWIIGGCLQTTYKNSLTRKELLLLRKMHLEIKSDASPKRTKDRYVSSKGESSSYEDDSDEDDSDDEYNLGQTEAEMTTAHRMCGCYPSDDRWVDDETRNIQSPWSFGFCSCLSRTFASLCCGKLFCCQLQILGACALAQEGRQIDDLVPIEKRRIDYVTFQSYLSYYNPIRRLRQEKDGNLCHYGSLSKLSRVLIKILAALTLFLFGISFIIPHNYSLVNIQFDWRNMVVFVATFGQSFVILYFIHWQWNRFDISLDAVIKFFACGFLLTTTTAIGFELLESILLKAFAVLLMKFLPLEVQSGNYNYGSSGSGSDVSIIDFTSYGSGLSSIGDSYSSTTAASSGKSAYKDAFVRQYPWIQIIFTFCSAYLVAALVEETCKHFGFLMVEHPDFMTETELQAAADFGVPKRDENMPDDRFEWGGGLDGLECGDCDDPDPEGTNYDSFDEKSARDRDPDRRSTAKNGASATSSSSNNPTVASGITMAKVELVPCPKRTYQSKAGAITVAMVAVSLGFQCCENLIYIFVYNNKDLVTEVAVLISRSLFPIHPLCAAIQSIGVIRQKLERDQSIGIGRILFPALMLHGTYDFTIMVLSFLSQLANDDGNDDDEVNGDSKLALVYATIGLFSSCGFVIAGVFYYVVESGKQLSRLESIDKARTFLGVKA